MLLLITLILIFSEIIGVFILRYAVNKRSFPGASYFVALVVFLMLYDAGYIGEINSHEFNTAFFWFQAEHIAIPAVPYLWLMMSLDFIQATERIKKPIKILMLSFSASFYLIYFTNPLHHLYITGYRFIYNGYFFAIQDPKGPVYIAISVVISLIGLVCAGVYLSGIIKSAHLHRLGYFIMLLAGVLQLFTVILNTSGSNALSIDYFPVFSGLSGVLYMIGIFRYVLFDTIPIATQAVYSESRDGIALIDISGRMFDMNKAFIELFCADSKPPRMTLSEFTAEHRELEGLIKNKGRINFSMKTGGEERFYKAELTNIISETDWIIGRILTVTDISVFVEHERALRSAAYTAQTAAANNELLFLQAQINPHFLANTINVISSLIKKDSEAAGKLLLDFGDYLEDCYMTRYSSAMVPLEYELHTVEAYVNIEKARYKERLNFELVCGVPRDILIPRLVIQPLVENAIRHGIVLKPEGGRVRLAICDGTGGIKIEVSDNGVGMSEQKIRELLDAGISQNGVGVKNINQRLIKMYGDGLKIISREGRGTAVSFRVAKLTDKCESNHDIKV